MAVTKLKMAVDNETERAAKNEPPKDAWTTMSRNEPQGVVKKRTEPHSRKNITEPLNNELPTKRTANEPNRFEPEPDETNRYEPHRQRTESKRAGCRNKPPRTAWTKTNLICARVPICAVGECVCVCVCVCARKRLHRNTHVPTTPARFPLLLPQSQPFVSRSCPLFCRPIIMKHMMKHGCHEMKMAVTE